MTRVLTLAAFVGGLLLGGWWANVGAQDRPYPVAVGDSLRLMYQSRTDNCEVAEIVGPFVSCKSAPHEWINLMLVLRLERRPK